MKSVDPDEPCPMVKDLLGAAVLKISPRSKDIGDGFTVHRLLPFHKKRMVGPFIFWDHMGPSEILKEKKMTVRAHPHIGLSTITYLFSGKILHRDSLGNEQYIQPGEVNWMTAGSGIVHSERATSEQESQIVHGIQLWVALPKDSEDVDPSFVHEKENQLPLIEQDGVNMRLIAGEFLGEKSPLPVFSPLFYLTCDLKSGAQVNLPIPHGQEAAVYLVDGSIDVNEMSLSSLDLCCTEDDSSVSIHAIEDSKIMIFGGQPFEEGRNIWWNFVSSDPDKIDAAKQKWKAQQFPSVINETEFIPLPES